MSIEYVQIPAPLIESKEFNDMPWGQQKFLINLYRKFHDVECFTIELNNPSEYFQKSGVTLNKRVYDLLHVGLIEICGHQKTKPYGKRRVFKFKEWK